MKRYTKLTAMALTVAGAMTLLAGCSSMAAASVDTAASTAQAEASPAESTPAETPAPTATPEPTPAPAPVLKTVDLRIQGSTMNAVFTYDEEGRVSRIDNLGGPDDYTYCAPLNVDYLDGQATVSYDPDYLAKFSEDEPFYPSVTDVQTYEDGSLKSVSAASGTGTTIWFNQDGLPTFYSDAQDDFGYLIDYVKDTDGKYQATKISYMFGLIFEEDKVEQLEDDATPELIVEYR